MHVAVRLGRAIAWFVLASLVALGAGGVVAGGDQPAGDATRPELTAPGDALMALRIDDLRTDLVALLGQVTRLTTVGRAVLVDLASRDEAQLGADLAVGDGLVIAVDTQAEALRQGIGRLLDASGSLRIGGATSAQVQRLAAAAETIRPLAAAWARVGLVAVPTLKLIDLLEQHDPLAFAAAKAGSVGRYADALAGLAEALKTLDAAKAIRDGLPAGANVATLDDWWGRNRTYDQALQTLYGLLQTSAGKVTPAIRTAFTAVQAAQAQLPIDTSGLAVIVVDLARTDATQVLLTIDAVRGSLTTAATTVH